MYTNRTHPYFLTESQFTPIMFEQEANWSAKNIILGLTMGVFVVLSLSSNILVILTILLTRKLRSMSSIFVVNMAICDFGVSVVSMPLVLSSLLNGGWIYSEIACKVTGCLFTTFAIGSILSTAVVALDRFFAIIYCLKYSTWKTSIYGGGALFVLWIMAGVFGLTPLIGWSDVRFDKDRFMCLITWYDSLSYAILNCIMCFLAPLVIMVVCYVKIIIVAHEHVRQIEDTNNYIMRNSPESSHISLNGAVAAAAMFSVRRLSMLSFPGNKETNPIEMDFNSGASMTTHASSFERDAKTIIRLVGLIIVFALCWTPYLYVNIAELINLSIPNGLLTASSWLILVNSCINPFSYAISSKRFRFAARKLLSHKYSRKCSLEYQTTHHRSSYSVYLKTLRSPSVSSDPGDNRKIMRMCSLDKAIRNVTELRPSSQSAPDIKLVRMSHQYLQVPQSLHFSSGANTQMPEPFRPYKEPDVVPLKARKYLYNSPRRFTSPDAIGQTKELLEEYVFSENNKARIKIKFDLVPD